jgi:four helix bundle protein
MGMDEGKPFDFEERTFLFAKRVRTLIRKLPRDVCNHEDARQLARASGSVAANYIEANESLGKKDFRMRARISRREAKESRLFLRLLLVTEPSVEEERHKLIAEATELIMILSRMIHPRE